MKLSFILAIAISAICILLNPITARAGIAELFQSAQHNSTSRVPKPVLVELAEQLFLPLQGELSGNIMVADFVDSRHLSQVPLSAEFGAVGQQLAESLSVAGVQYGFNIVSSSLGNARMISASGQRVLTREPQHLSAVKAEYVLTGTISQLPNGLMINARIITYKNRQIISAHSVLLPYQTQPKMTKRNGYFYRKN